MKTVCLTAEEQQLLYDNLHAASRNCACKFPALKTWISRIDQSTLLQLKEKLEQAQNQTESA